MEPTEAPSRLPDGDGDVDDEPEVPTDLIPPDVPVQPDDSPEGPEGPQGFEEGWEAGSPAVRAGESEIPEEPQEPDAHWASTESGPGRVDDAADDEGGEPASAEDGADSGPLPEGAPLWSVFSKAGDSLTGPHAPAEGVGDRHVAVDRPAFNAMEIPQYNVCLYEYGTPLDRSDGGHLPLFNGPRPGDCGVIATMGAVAGHLPEAISSRVTENDDGTYQVTLHQVSADGFGDLAPYVPTGAVTVLTITPELVVPSLQPDAPAYAQVGTGGHAWSAILGKAFAGIDQTWGERGSSQGVLGHGFQSEFREPVQHVGLTGTGTMGSESSRSTPRSRRPISALPGPLTRAPAGLRHHARPGR
ncbi:hypothetical protein GCM10010302_74770 [Streptomyces polychromogenes]|uniref:Uncharacterized protein n=1 Tax=Streptomyces polychromogenes TaxID=67342 RepID=A0ABP3FV60_9ACTN